MLDPAPLTPVTLQIQRIETVPTSVRERALRELRAVTKQATDGGADAGNAKLDAAAARKEAESFTSVRKPGMVCLLAWCHALVGLSLTVSVAEQGSTATSQRRTCTRHVKSWNLSFDH